MLGVWFTYEGTLELEVKRAGVDTLVTTTCPL